MSDFSKPTQVRARAALEPSGQFKEHTITRRACGPKDVVIAIKWAGICHSDIHQVREEWGPAIFPMVPGHEIAGEIVAVGSEVKNFKVGDHGGVGCLVDSCRDCPRCRQGDEQYCQPSGVFTYNSKYKFKHCAEWTEAGGNTTYGGYSTHIVVDENYALNIPKNLDLAGAAPLLCAGITVYSPIMHYGLKTNMKFGVIGLGGLGHMAAKFGVAFGCHTTIISRGQAKRDSALNELKVDNYIDSTNEEEMKAAANSLDFVICTVSAPYDINAYLTLMKNDAKFIVVGAPPSPVQMALSPLIFKRVNVTGSLIGGIRETQEMLDFCGKKNILCDVEKINASEIDTAYERTVKADVKYRFVIDIASI